MVFLNLRVLLCLTHTHTPKADTLAEKATRAKEERKNKTWDIK